VKGNTKQVTRLNIMSM